MSWKTELGSVPRRRRRNRPCVKNDASWGMRRESVGQSRRGKKRQPLCVTSSPPCRATGKKSLGAYAVRGHHSDRTGLAWPWSPSATVSQVGRSERAEWFPAVATGPYRLWRGPWVWPRPDKVAGTLGAPACGQYGAEDHGRAWGPPAGATGTDGQAGSKSPGRSATNRGTRWVAGAACDGRQRSGG